MKRVIGVAVVLLLFGVVFVSGCVSNGTGNKVSKNYSIEEGNTPTVQSFSDGSYSIGGLIDNTGNVGYTNVKLTVTAYDTNNNVLFEKNTTIADLQAGSSGHYDITGTWKGTTISHAGIKVVNATPA